MNKNDVFENVIIEGYNSEAMGVARIEGRAVFVPYAKKGNAYDIRILKVTSAAVWGKIDETPETDCPYFPKCGGCQCRHLTYDEELQFKFDKVNAALERIGHQTFKAETIVPSEPLRYRNKAVFNVSDGKFGFYRPRSHDLIEIEDCLLQSEKSLRIAESIDKTGLNHIFIRDNVCVVMGKEYNGPIPDEVSGFAICNNARDNSILDGPLTTLYGSDVQEETLCGFRFLISPKAFFQVNPKQAEKLYEIAVGFAGEGDTAVELYCGAGTISMCLSRNFKKVIATEIVKDAVDNARSNAKLNGIDNIDFICGDASDIHDKADVVLVDPPRKGMSKDTIDSILEISPDRIVYVSCNPATLARDISLLSSDYEITRCIAVDMFPRTHHVECICLLSKKNTSKKNWVEIGLDAEDYYKIKESHAE